MPEADEARDREAVAEQAGEEGTTVPFDPAREGDGGGAPQRSGHRDLGIGVVILAICGVLWWETSRFPEVPPALSQNVSAAFFPRVLLATVAILASILILRGWWQQPESRQGLSRQTVASGVTIVICVSLIPTLGMLASLCLCALVLPMILGERRWMPLTAYALALPAAIWLIFTQLLQLRLPGGTFGF